MGEFNTSVATHCIVSPGGVKSNSGQVCVCVWRGGGVKIINRYCGG